MEYNLLLQEAFEFCCHLFAKELKLYNNRPGERENRTIFYTWNPVNVTTRIIKLELILGAEIIPEISPAKCLCQQGARKAACKRSRVW